VQICYFLVKKKLIVEKTAEPINCYY